MATFHVLCRSLAAVAFLLFIAPVPHGAGAESGQASAESAVLPGTETDALSGTVSTAAVADGPPEPCRDCGGLRYYPPSAQPGTRSGVAGAQEARPDPSPDSAPRTAPGIEFGRPHLSSDPRVNIARALIEQNRFAEALEILKPLALEDRPDLTDVRFLLGLAASRGSQEPDVTDEEQTKLLNLAIAAFRSILIHQPDLVRVRLELGLAFFFKGNDDLAGDHFERALVGRLPDNVVRNIRNFLNIMRARRRWSGYFGFSLAPDTNINAASDAQFIYINGLPFRRDARSQASSDIGVVGWGGAEYQYPLANRWRLRSGFNFNHREYKGGQFDQTFLWGYVGPRWLISPTTEMSLLASASQRWWGGSPFNYDFGARLEVEHRLLSGVRLSGRATWQNRINQQQKFLEGPLMVFSLGASYVPFPIVQVNALVGFQQQDARARRWDSLGYWGRLGANVSLPWGVTVGLSAEFRWTDFESGWFPFVPDNSARRDQTRILGATLLNRGLTVYGFSPQVAFSNQVRESNGQVFDFKRNLVELRWVRQF